MKVATNTLRTSAKSQKMRDTEVEIVGGMQRKPQ